MYLSKGGIHGYIGYPPKSATGIEYLLKSIKSLKTIAGQDPLTWPTVKLVCSRIRDDDGGKVYQGSVLANYNLTTLKACANSALADLERLEERMKSRLEWSDLELLRVILVFLDTKSWGCLLYTSPSPRDATLSRMPSSA